MSLLAFSINYKTAPLTLRECVALTAEQREKVSQHLNSLPFVLGCVILVTCNRSEFYFSTSDNVTAKRHVIDALCQLQQLTPEALLAISDWYEDVEVVRHLMEVTSGMDSMILGEPQILGQVKQAYRLAQQSTSLSRELTHLFQQSFKAAKRVRSQTQIGRYAISTTFTACLIARQHFDNISSINVLLIGAGETIALMSKHISQHGANQIIIANRTVSRAEAIVSPLKNAIAISLKEIDRYLAEVDLIVTATASPLPILTTAQLTQALAKRQRHPMLIIDMAVPRDVQSSVATLSGIKLYTIDDLQHIIHHSRDKRQHAAFEARKIIEEHCQHFMAWARVQRASTSIQCYRQQSEQIKTELVNKALAALAQGKDSQMIIQELAYKLTNRLTHAPTKALQQAASANEHNALQFLRTSLGLDSY